MIDQLIDFPWYEYMIQWIMTYGVKILIALLLLRIATHRSRYLFRGLRTALQKADLGVSAIRFLMSFIRIAFYIFVIVTIAGMMGVQMTTFIAILGAAGLAIGLSLQASLANLAGGIIILIFKPYVIGDFVSIKGEVGTVTDITVFMTQLRTPEGKKAFIPNGRVVDDMIVNFSAEEMRRVDVRVGISYNADIRTAREVLLAPMHAHALIMKEPAPQVLVEDLGDSSVVLLLRCHVPTSEFLTVLYELPELAKYALDEAGISIPFPQRVVHMK